MKTTFTLLTIAISLIIIPILLSEPSFNGSSPGCDGAGCHDFEDGLVSVTIIDPLNVEVTVSGTTEKVGGELVDESGTVVAVIEQTNSNPFILTAPDVGNYIVNAGFKSPGPRRWDSARVAIVVPVELTSFTASVNENDVTLVWQTAIELNNSGFGVERIRENEEWEKVGFVSGNGTTTEIHSYTFADKDVPAGTYSYRINQIDYDGTNEYFELEQVIEITLLGKFALLQNYPNPFNPGTTIKFVIPEKSNVVITIFNSIGEDVLTLVDENKEAGSYEVNFNASGFTSGIYYYKLQTDNFAQTKKMILMK